MCYACFCYANWLLVYCNSKSLYYIYFLNVYRVAIPIRDNPSLDVDFLDQHMNMDIEITS